MTASENGIKIIKQFEGLVLHAYKDPGSKNGLHITIGYGSTMYKNGKKIQLGDTITKEEAIDLLHWEVENITSVLRFMNPKLYQKQSYAVTSLIYNTGIGFFMTA